ncbi:MAG: type IV toxin-antitoxin system AbiEi family antitoxin [Candidatus Woesebacteria bacterium]|nr:type IV toxin-antitoxin system AbiEi family antitoxin [Candidatus Woesebacteria bacterium]
MAAQGLGIPVARLDRPGAVPPAPTFQKLRYPRPHALTIYLHKEHGQKNLTRLVAQNKLRADPQGDIEILDAFWDFEDEKPIPETVPPLLAYADLIATLDPRNLEAAKLIHDRYLATTQAKSDL